MPATLLIVLLFLLVDGVVGTGDSLVPCYVGDYNICLLGYWQTGCTSLGELGTPSVNTGSCNTVDFGSSPSSFKITVIDANTARFEKWSYSDYCSGAAGYSITIYNGQCFNVYMTNCQSMKGNWRPPPPPPPKPCAVNCRYCANEGTPCYECNAPFYLHQGECFATCPEGSYPTTSFCFECASNCERCTTGNTCDMCYPDMYHHTHGTCVEECPSPYQPDVGNTTCVKCSSGCDSCYNSYTCQQCHTGNYMLNAACYNSCPHSYYGNDTTGNCEGCKDDCVECSSASSCTSCTNNLYAHNDECIGSCPDFFFASNATGSCEACPTNCSTCYNCTVCTSCTAGAVLYNDNCDNTSCPSTYTNSNGICILDDLSENHGSGSFADLQQLCWAASLFLAHFLYIYF